MDPYNTINFTNTHFEHPILPKIHGQPTFTALSKLKKYLKANAKSVRSNLGGGFHGHLGLVLTPAEYAMISDVAFEEPVHPLDFVPPRNAQPLEAIQRERAHTELIRQFEKCQDVKQALIRQIVASVESQYIDELRDGLTNTINKSIPEILDYLFSNFATVTAKDVSREEEKVKTYHWNISEPPMIFFNMIEDLQTLAEAAKIPRTEEMLISHGLEIIQRTGDMEKGLTEWHEKEDNEVSWEAFKRHFSAAYHALRKVRGTIIKHTPFHEANVMVQQLNDNISDLRSEFRNSMSMIGTPTNDNHYAHSSSSPSSLSPSANSVTNESLLQLILQLQQQMITMQNPQQQTTQKRSKQFIRNHTDHYCWTHGACGHDSKDCKNKKDGHQDHATFTNKMGGSQSFCKPTQDRNNNSKSA